VENGPPDPGAFDALIEAYDKSGDRAGATRSFRAIARAKGHNFALYQELGGRLKKLERPAEAERAYTNLVEDPRGGAEAPGEDPGEGKDVMEDFKLSLPHLSLPQGGEREVLPGAEGRGDIYTTRRGEIGLPTFAA
jgi:hypothetical protein